MCCLHVPARLETLDADVSCGARICSTGLVFLQPPHVFRRPSVLQNCTLALALLQGFINQCGWICSWMARRGCWVGRMGVFSRWWLLLLLPKALLT